MYLRYQRDYEADLNMEDLHKPFARRPRKQALSAIIEKIVMDKQRNRDRVFDHSDSKNIEQCIGAHEVKMELSGDSFDCVGDGLSSETTLEKSSSVADEQMQPIISQTSAKADPASLSVGVAGSCVTTVAASGDHPPTDSITPTTTASASATAPASASAVPLQQSPQPHAQPEAAFPILQESLMTNPAKPVSWRPGAGPLVEEEEEMEEEDDPEEKEEPGIEPERLKAFNMFVRLFVDENLDRTVPISKQPRERVQAIMDSCARQFPEFGERARKRLRTYLKACRRTKRIRESFGGEGSGTTTTRTSRSAPPHLSSAQAEQILAAACQNESENVHRMMIGLEPVGQPVQNMPAPASSLSSVPADPPEVPVRPCLYPQSQPSQPDRSASAAQYSVVTQPPASGQLPAVAQLIAGGQSPAAGQLPAGGVQPTAAALYQANMSQLLQQMMPSGPPPMPSFAPGELFLRRPPAAQLSIAELTAVRQLVRGYRESANFLRRSADELELLITRSDR